MPCYSLPCMKPVQNIVLVELHVPDFERVRDYYGKLGFKVIRETKPENKSGYLVLRMRPSLHRPLHAELGRFHA